MRTPWFVRGRRKYVAATLLVADLSVGCWSAAMAIGASSSGVTTTTGSTGQVAGVASTSSSQVVVHWKDGRTLDPSDKNQSQFSNLQLTVSQTKDLTDQGLLVSWVGGKPTAGSGAPSDYLQIMQCWASPGSAPTPQQCQWGTPNAANAVQTGLAASSRDLLIGQQADPKQLPSGTCTAEFTHHQFGQPDGCTVPFWSATDPHKSTLGWTNDQYNAPPFTPAQSNEVTYARTADDGTGQYIFNLQSALTAPYLGCGNQALHAAGDTCYLVVVPRGEYNLNGELAANEPNDGSYGSNFDYVAGSPLSASAWQDRIQIPLSFTPIGADCKLGSSTYATAGTEFVGSVFASWQSALCRQGTTFGYSRITDPQARQALVPGGGPVMTYQSAPLDSGAAGSSTLVYAPVANSAIVFTYLIDKNYVSDPKHLNPDYGKNGTQVTDLKLTPLIVAKLLTQSYRSDTPGDGHGAGATVPSTNPDSLLQDPDFLALNPDFKFFNATQIPDGLIAPFGNSDAAKQVWAWLRSDSAAKRFLAGQKVDGASINTAYAGLNLATDASINSFPKNDQTSYLGPDWPKPGYGTLDMRPYAASFADAALKVVNANSGKKTIFDPTLSPPQAVGSGAQTPGVRFEIAITTSEAAALYGLPSAAVVPDANASNPGVLPTSSSIAAQIAGASVPTSVTGVFGVDPGAPVNGGYPLALRTYAAVNVCATALPALKADAQFLAYAAGAGQTPGTQLGQLPPGYSSLTSADKTLTNAAAATLRAEVASPKCSQHTTPKPTATATPSSSGTAAGSGGSVPNGTTPPASSGGAVPSSTKTTVAGDALPGGITPMASISAAGQYGLLAALCFFAPCAVVGPTLLRASRSGS
ncbi:hypothetical protein Back2_22600 [Nocardioides baekrokdamisoli]|uniref:PBP domain-containing protein n=2 Tax=Nocardioides baekrokdamisoli TaxID=1804624 RepID=A0A3G9J035_9ACTN|nr:hypothetical protein Back2_22600 [Nocardioides baekrokdamisoli]